MQVQSEVIFDEQELQLKVMLSWLRHKFGEYFEPLMKAAVGVAPNKPQELLENYRKYLALKRWYEDERKNDQHKPPQWDFVRIKKPHGDLSMFTKRRETKC